MTKEIFIDSARLPEIEKWVASGVVTGVTTNQLIMLRDGVHPRGFSEHIERICEIAKGPVSVELTDSTADAGTMATEATRLRAIHDLVVIKVPLIPGTTKSLEVIRELTARGIPVNVTCMMTVEQMMIAALATKDAEQAYISLFWGRAQEDHEQYRTNPEWVTAHPKVGPESEINSNPGRITETVADFIRTGGQKQPRIIIGSVRNARQVGEAFAHGAHIVTVPPAILEAMIESERTRQTIIQFDQAWEELKQK